MTGTGELRLGGGSVTFAVAGRAAHACIERPESRNALSPSVIDGLDAAVDHAQATGVSVLTLRGRGGTISAGADLKYLRTVLDDAGATARYIASIGAVLDRVAAAPFVSVCVVDGYALAGGCEILLACDLAVVSARSLIGDRHLEYGLLPGAGGSVRLARALPAARARRLLYTAEMVDGTTAADLGLVSHVAPADELDATVDALVSRLCRHDPVALAQMKRLYQAATTMPAPDAHAAERRTLLRHLTGAAAEEGLAAFEQGRAPDFGMTRGTGQG